VHIETFLVRELLFTNASYFHGVGKGGCMMR